MQADRDSGGDVSNGGIPEERETVIEKREPVDDHLFARWAQDGKKPYFGYGLLERSKYFERIRFGP